MDATPEYTKALYDRLSFLTELEEQAVREGRLRGQERRRIEEELGAIQAKTLHGLVPGTIVRCCSRKVGFPQRLYQVARFRATAQGLLVFGSLILHSGEIGKAEFTLHDYGEEGLWTLISQPEAVHPKQPEGDTLPCCHIPHP